MTTAKDTAAQVRELPIDSLVVSPEETRKTIDQAALRELATSIEKDGVIEALLVRPIDLDCMSGEPLPGPARAKDAYEIVAGQRRWLASKLAGKPTCPCIVREMSDDEARALRVVSNEQREDLPPMEQAEAFGKLLDVPGATVESVAAAVAKSPSYVGRRVQLLKAIEPVRQALKAGAIEVGHALLLAPLDEALQRQLLTCMQVGATLVEPEDVEDESGEPGECRYCGCTEDDPCPGGCSWANAEETVCTNPDCLEQFRAETGQQNDEWRKTHYSIVELRREIEETSYRDLKDAPFPLAADLPPVPCADCPKRAGNAQLLFDDCAQDTCTDRPCFNRKLNFWISAELGSATLEKRKLLKLTSNWTSDKDKVRVSDHGGARELKTPDECPHGEEGIWIDGRNAGGRAMVCRKADCKTHRGGESRSSSSSGRTQASPKEQEERKKKLAKLNAEKKYRAALFAAVAKAPINHIYASDLNLEVCLYAIGRGPGQYEKKVAEALGWPESIFGWGGGKELRERLVKLAPVERLRIALLAAHAGELGVNEYAIDAKPKDLEKLAGFLGVDVKNIRAESTAKAAKKLKPGEHKPGCPIDAQRKRWAAARTPAKKTAKKGGAK